MISKEEFEEILRQSETLVAAGATNEEFIKWNTNYLRRRSSENFPDIKPEIIEALILFYEEIAFLVYEMEDVDVKAPYVKTGPCEGYTLIGSLMGQAFAKVSKSLSQGNRES